MSYGHVRYLRNYPNGSHILLSAQSSVQIIVSEILNKILHYEIFGRIFLSSRELCLLYVKLKEPIPTICAYLDLIAINKLASIGAI